MILNPAPQPGRDYGPGWAGFTFHLDSHLLSPAIALQTAPEAFRTGRLVPAHVFTVIDNNQVAEALGQGYTIHPLAKYLDPADARVTVWFARPRGLTAKAAAFMAVTARLWAEGGTPYDLGAIGGFVLEEQRRLQAGLRNRLEDPDRLFCSEAYVRLLQLAARLFDPALPEAIRARHASSWSPWGLWQCEGLWVTTA
ncbi:MAG: hypothetical protein V1797_07500 [Pseudomonadota bacterium]